MSDDQKRKAKKKREAVAKKRHDEEHQKKKRGDAYQDAVGEVARHLDPTAQIDIGIWVEGPDGRRDLDVSIRPLSGVPPLILIECKDWKVPVGIAVVDAIDSKRRDLGAVAIICSNSGFTKDAFHKAARIGIPTLSVLIAGDQRIRVAVETELYARKINVQTCVSTWHFLVPDAAALIPPGTAMNEIIANGGLTAAWIRDKCLMLVGGRKKSGATTARYTFKEPINLQIRGITLPAVGVDLSISFEVQWCSQMIQVGSSSGMYEYLTGRTWMSGNGQYEFRGVDFDKWVPLATVPDGLLTDTALAGEIVVSISSIGGIDDVGGAIAPDINSLIASEKIIESGQ